ncbi:MAG: HlyD family secretion protein, partial [Hyphomicrobiales bacterium]|nr:HlyD family secretion protein [Hyphomicrobiales bacterium]
TKVLQTTKLLAEINTRAEMFRTARIRQLQSRISAGHSDIGAATAKHVQADRHLKRQTYLLSSDAVAQSRFQEAERDERVAKLAVTALQRRLNVLTVELEALQSGVFVGDNYNDIPFSSQRSYDLRQRMIDFKANIERNDRAMARLQEELADEERRARRLVQADIVAPRRARVWEVLTAPGEQVNRGQELVRLLDCSLPVVTAAVTETVYNSLSIGAPATFRYRQTGHELPGRVVQLTGVASARANLAIIPNALKKESYRVMVKVPGLAEKANCAIGQTGRVLFNSDGATTPAGAP